MPLPALATFEVDATETQRGSVIWMHGLGATNHDFDDVVPVLETPYLRYVFPAAPQLPVTINGGMVMPAWYDILSFDDPPLREEETSVRASASRVEALIHREVERGVPAEHIVLMGFSQGGAMALHTGLRYPERLAGIAVLSGYLVLPGTLEAERSPENKDTPLLFCHGSLDPVVPYPLGYGSFRRLEALGASAEFHSFEMQHSMCLEEILVLQRWLARLFQVP